MEETSWLMGDSDAYSGLEGGHGGLKGTGDQKLEVQPASGAALSLQPGLRPAHGGRGDGCLAGGFC